ncbi:MAG: ATP-binding protein, partial [Solirubrobacteraceae bacterium]
MLTASALIGRERELDQVTGFLRGGGGGGGGALVLEGEPGIGKTAVWEAALDIARECGLRVLVARAWREEAALDFCGLLDLLGGVAEEALAPLPSIQRRALESALLLEEGDATTGARAVSAAVLGALRAIALTCPTLVAIDDVAWLDGASARALAFAARRLEREPVRFLFTRRTSPGQPGP